MRIAAKLAKAACFVALVASAAFFAFVTVKYPIKYRAAVERSARENGLSPSLVFAVIATESGFDETAVSSKGAVGLMQVTPATAEYVRSLTGEDFVESDLTNGEYNIELGCAYLAYLLKSFSDETDAIAAYNAGEGNVRRWKKEGAGVPFKETRDYVKRVERAEKIYEFRRNFFRL